MAEIDLSLGLELPSAWRLAAAGNRPPPSFFISFRAVRGHRTAYVRQWQRTAIESRYDFSKESGDGGSMYRLSRGILLAHEDKIFQGALIASLSIPGRDEKRQRPGRVSSGLDA